jgi:hypothetical protein
VAETDGPEGACVAELGDAAVDVSDGASAIDGATRGACDSTFVVTDGAAVVGDAGTTVGAVVVCVTGGGGGSTGSTACCVCGGAATLGAAGAS